MLAIFTLTSSHETEVYKSIETRISYPLMYSRIVLKVYEGLEKV